MTESKRDEYTDEIFEYSNYSRFGVEKTDDSVEREIPSSECDSLDHPESTADTIREGQFITAVIQRKDPPEEYSCSHPIWVVEKVACYNCAVASLYDRVDKSNPVAVVEGACLPGEGCLILDPRYVWDIHIPNEPSMENP